MSEKKTKRKMEKMPQKWFEMPKVKKRFFDRKIWIPLKETKVLLREGKIGMLGYKQEYFGVGSIAVPISQKSETEKLGWSDIGIGRSSMGYVIDGEYVPSNIFKNSQTLTAEQLVLERRGNSIEHPEWHLNQDLVITLGLKREGDSWLAISYGYEEVAKIERDKNGRNVSFLIKSSYLKDYLCARKMALYMTSYRSRVQILEDRNHIKWSDPKVEKTKTDIWEGRITEIHEGGHLFGSGFSVLHVSRTNVDYDEDIPEFGFPTDENVKSKSFKGKFKGEKLYRINGELWRNEWVQPALHSYIVCDEKAEPTSFFITDNSGKIESRKTLAKNSRWLWFNPSVVNSLLSVRGGFLGWYTKDTGTIGCSPDYGVHFGVNKIGLINVFAKDISLLPDWQQKIWAGHNVSPDGKVSPELLMSQMKAKPALTQAPEDYILKGIELLDKIILKKYGISIIKEHSNTNHILKKIHRFRAINEDGLLELAKDLYRLVGERINAKEIKKLVKPKKNAAWGQLRSLEELLALKIGKKIAHELISPLWGIYTLRLADSHLPSKEDLNKAYSSCQIDTKQPTIIQGYQLINCCVGCLYEIIKILQNL